MKKFSFVLLLTAVLFSVSSTFAEEASFKFHGFFDTYFVTDNDHLPQTSGFKNERSEALTNFYKEDFGINIAQFCMYGNYGKARGKMALHFGDLADFASTQNSLGNIQQANLGYNLWGNYWLDAGLFLSHIGDESFIPGHNWLSSYSLVRMHQPFFQAGVRFGYETEKFKAQLYVLNAKGTFAENNHNKTYGVFVWYKPTEHFAVSYGNLLGNEQPGNPKNGLLEMLHNVCAEYEFSKDFAVKAELDYSSFESPIEDGDPYTSMGIAAQAHYKFTPKCSGTFRFAMLSETDPEEDPDFSGTHITLGTEYNPTPNTYFRLEGSMLSYGDDFKYFRDADGKATNSRMEVAANFGIYIK